MGSAHVFEYKYLVAWTAVRYHPCIEEFYGEADLSLSISPCCVQPLSPRAAALTGFPFCESHTYYRESAEVDSQHEARCPPQQALGIFSRHL